MKIRINRQTVLRLFEKEDTPALFEVIQANKTHLAEWKRWIDRLENLNATQKFIEKNKRAYKQFVTASVYEQQHPGFQLGIFKHSTDNIMGMIGYQGIHLTNKICSVGYWVDAREQGKGIITQSCRALVAHSFNVLNFNRIEIQCTVENQRSRAIPERLGFTKEAILAEFEWKEERHTFVDHVLYRLLKRDFSPHTQEKLQ